MNKPDKISIQSYAYDLPEDRIAKTPIKYRDQSKLLIYKKGQINKRIFTEVPEILLQSDLLVFNVTKVVQARLIFHKSTGSKIEIFCLEPYQPSDYQLAYSSFEPVEFTCLVGNAKKWKSGTLELSFNGGMLTAEQVKKVEDKFIIRFSWDNSSISFADILEAAGSTPIPPYLKRDARKEDAESYQTVYAKDDGSVAAPTAGLHFTEEILAKLTNNGIEQKDLVLHVGAGTFIPVKHENAVDHEMHAELVTVERSLIKALLDRKRIIAVGTTSTRSLESVYWIGVRAFTEENFSFNDLYLDQWEAYSFEHEISKPDALHALLQKMDAENIRSFSFRTRIMIVPGYQFKIIDGLFTNFHQPKSTLLLLIAALTGDHWKDIYKYALENDFRFLSYGDSSLLLCND